MRYFFGLGVGCLIIYSLIVVVEGFLPGLFTGTEPFRTLYGNVVPNIAVMGTTIGGYLLYITWREDNRAIADVNALVDEIGNEGIWHQIGRESFLLSNSTDREVLKIINETGGRVPDVLGELSRRALVAGDAGRQQALAKLVLLGLAVVSPSEKKIFLTSRGIDTLNTPAILLSSRIPDTIWQYIYRLKVSFLQENWGNVIVEAARALEASLQERLRWAITQNPPEWEKAKEELPKKDPALWTAGVLRDALVKLGFIKTNTLEDFLVLNLIKLRNLVHDKKDAYTFGPTDADKCDIYLSLLMRNWYRPL